MFGSPEQELIENGKHRTNNFVRGTDGLWRLKKREEMQAAYPNFVHRADPSLPKSVYEIGTVRERSFCISILSRERLSSFL